MSRPLAYAFPNEESRTTAQAEISEKYCDLQTSTARQLLSNGYEFILFIENKDSFNFNLLLASIMAQHGGMDREKIRNAEKEHNAD